MRTLPKSRDIGGQTYWWPNVFKRIAFRECTMTLNPLTTPLYPLGDATRPTNCPGSHNEEASRTSVLDDAQGMELQAMEKVRFVRGESEMALSSESRE